MSIKNTLSISEARKKIFDIAEAVQKPGVHYTFTANGKPTVVVMSATEFESWAETLEVIRDFPDLDKHVAEADHAVKTGAYKTWSTLEDLKKDWGFTVADKSAKKYGIHASRRAKSTKKHK